MSLPKLGQSGREIGSTPPLVEWAQTAAHLPPVPALPVVFTTTEVDVHKLMYKYGELCHKQALEEAYKWMLDRHEAQKHRDNYMLVEANRFKKDLLTLPRVEQGSVSEQVKPHSSGEVVHTVAWDVVQAKDQPS